MSPTRIVSALLVLVLGAAAAGCGATTTGSPSGHSFTGTLCGQTGRCPSGPNGG